ncbi:unnamed protein product [Calypogeia fissa]
METSPKISRTSGRGGPRAERETAHDVNAPCTVNSADTSEYEPESPTADHHAHEASGSRGFAERSQLGDLPLSQSELSRDPEENLASTTTPKATNKNWKKQRWIENYKDLASGSEPPSPTERLDRGKEACSAEETDFDLDFDREVKKQLKEIRKEKLRELSSRIGQSSSQSDDLDRKDSCSEPGFRGCNREVKSNHSNAREQHSKEQPAYNLRETTTEKRDLSFSVAQSSLQSERFNRKDSCSAGKDCNRGDKSKHSIAQPGQNSKKHSISDLEEISDEETIEDKELARARKDGRALKGKDCNREPDEKHSVAHKLQQDGKVKLAQSVSALRETEKENRELALELASMRELNKRPRGRPPRPPSERSAKRDSRSEGRQSNRENENYESGTRKSSRLAAQVSGRPTRTGTSASAQQASGEARVPVNWARMFRYCFRPPVPPVP